MDDQRLTFVRLTGEKTRDGHLLAEYTCSCGGTAIIIRSRVNNGYTRSCGCLNAETKPNLRHGRRGSRTYSSWQAMLQRCQNPATKGFSRWGGRGVTVCERWTDFKNFLEDMGERPEGTTIDRIDVDGNYEPTNCRWATPKQQARNRRNAVRVKTSTGVEDLADYAEKIGITLGAAHMRLKRGTLEGASYA